MNSKSILGMRVLALLHIKAETKQRIPRDSIRQQVCKVRNVEVCRAFFLAQNSRQNCSILDSNAREASAIYVKLFCTLRVRPFRKKKGNMALYAVDVRDRVIQQVSRPYNAVDNKRVFFIKAASAKRAWAKVRRVLETIGSSDCLGCNHRHCRACEECSVAKQYSDYWICHSCGELNRRVPQFHHGVPNGLGET